MWASLKKDKNIGQMKSVLIFRGTQMKGRGLNLWLPALQHIFEIWEHALCTIKTHRFLHLFRFGRYETSPFYIKCDDGFQYAHEMRTQAP